ncbi:unannotated protein [freshwater metagenome]|uniref:Unannotated protein n=1 Tax=freshwater metagenome TaxID=449393 RepID=A0A6J6G931_9ZZZZ
MSGVQAVGAQAVASVLGVQHAGDSMRRSFRHGVGESPPSLARRCAWRQRGGSRREMHEHSAPSGDHAGQELLQQDQGGDRVTLDDGAQQLHGHVAEPIVHARSLINRVGHQAIDRRELVQRRVRGVSHRLLVGQIHGHAHDPRAGAGAIGDRATFGGHLLDGTRQGNSRQRIVQRRAVEPGATGHVAGGENEMVPALGQCQRGGPSDAPTRAGHHHNARFRHGPTVRVAAARPSGTVAP